MVLPFGVGYACLFTSLCKKRRDPDCSICLRQPQTLLTFYDVKQIAIGLRPGKKIELACF